jgi:hypothetical protein
VCVEAGRARRKLGCGKGQGGPGRGGAGRDGAGRAASQSTLGRGRPGRGMAARRPRLRPIPAGPLRPGLPRGVYWVPHLALAGAQDRVAQRHGLTHALEPPGGAAHQQPLLRLRRCRRRGAAAPGRGGRRGRLGRARGRRRPGRRRRRRGRVAGHRDAVADAEGGDDQQEAAWREGAGRRADCCSPGGGAGAPALCGRGCCHETGPKARGASG